MLLTQAQREQRKQAAIKLGWTTPNNGLRLMLSSEQKAKLASWGKTGTEDFELIKVIKNWIDGLPHAIDRNV